MRGGVHWYAAQAIPQIDTDSAVVAKKATMAKSAIAEKGHVWMEINYHFSSARRLTIRVNIRTRFVARTMPLKTMSTRGTQPCLWYSSCSKAKRRPILLKRKTRAMKTEITMQKTSESYQGMITFRNEGLWCSFINEYYTSSVWKSTNRMPQVRQHLLEFGRITPFQYLKNNHFR